MVGTGKRGEHEINVDAFAEDLLADAANEGRRAAQADGHVGAKRKRDLFEQVFERPITFKPAEK